ncbi:MAG: hypothetical protein KDD19_03280 [Phaeodactylibacter sp.]|nr:hypothetical protein [Phaeodactylibacter sp.]
MRTIFNFGLLLLLLFVLFRLTHIRKEKQLLKSAMGDGFNGGKARHFRYLTIFQMIMHSIWCLIILYFIYYYFIR